MLNEGRGVFSLLVYSNYCKILFIHSTRRHRKVEIWRNFQEWIRFGKGVMAKTVENTIGGLPYARVEQARSALLAKQV